MAYGDPVDPTLVSIWTAIINAVEDNTLYVGWVICSDDTFEDIDADSLLKMQIILDIETALSASFGASEDVLMECQTLGELRDRIYDIVRDDD